MRENRKNFPKYLHGAIFLLSLIFGTFGILGYIRFTDHVEQLISDNLTYGTLSIIVQVTLCVGILFTYPLQMYPVVQIAENFFIKETKERCTITASFKRESEYSPLWEDNSRLQYGDPAPESLEEDISDSSEPKSEEEMASVGKNGSYNVLIRRPKDLCSCHMVSECFAEQDPI